jgi:hypothetical protein
MIPAIKIANSPAIFGAGWNKDCLLAANSSASPPIMSNPAMSSLPGEDWRRYSAPAARTAAMAPAEAPPMLRRR